MTTLKERFHDFGVADEGDVVPLEDFDDLPSPNAVRIQALANHGLIQHIHELEEQAEADAKIMREKSIADQALQNAGVFVTLEQHRQNQLDLLDVASGSSMYTGLKNGGSQAPEVIERYGDALPRVEAGAHRNHQNLVNRELPRIYRANELIDAGFEPQEVMFDAKTTVRSELMSRYGGPDNKVKRATKRQQLRHKS